jgi:hypothetical protein
MGILKAIAVDIENLIQEGYTDREIAVSVGMDRNIIQNVIDYFRYEYEKYPEISKKINTRSNN